MPVRNLLGWILSISMFTQKFIKILHTFQNLALGKASTDDKCHFAIPWARSFQHQIVCKTLSKYSKRFELNYTFFKIWTSANPRPILNVIWHLKGYILPIPKCMQNFITIFHSVQEIWPFSLFQNLELGKTSTDEKWRLAISWARSWELLLDSLTKIIFCRRLFIILINTFHTLFYSWSPNKMVSFYLNSVK